MIFGVPLGFHLATIGTIIGCKKSTICRRVPRRVPGKDLGPILGGFGRYSCVFLTIFSMFLGLSLSRVFLDGNVWNMDEKGMACAYILQALPPVLAGLLHR